MPPQAIFRNRASLEKFFHLVLYFLYNYGILTVGDVVNRLQLESAKRGGKKNEYFR